jgi:hypothetical protein
VEIIPISLSEEKPVNFHLVSCRQELDLLFFNMSQRIQAKFIVEGYPPDVVTIPWRDLIAQGYISPLATTQQDVLLDRPANIKATLGKYGTERYLSEEQVRAICIRCKAHQEHGGTIENYYNHVLSSSISDKFALGTLKDWLKDKRFR